QMRELQGEVKRVLGSQAVHTPQQWSTWFHQMAQLRRQWFSGQPFNNVKLNDLFGIWGSDAVISTAFKMAKNSHRQAEPALKAFLQQLTADDITNLQTLYANAQRGANSWDTQFASTGYVAGYAHETSSGYYGSPDNNDSGLRDVLKFAHM